MAGFFPFFEVTRIQLPASVSKLVVVGSYDFLRRMSFGNLASPRPPPRRRAPPSAANEASDRPRDRARRAEALTDAYLLIYNEERYETPAFSDVNSKPLDIALSLYEIAGPIFVSLKEQVKSAGERAGSHPEAKELTFTQLRILFAIEYGKDQVGILARSAKVAQPAMSKMVDHLINLKLARRDPHPTDRRQIKLRLTARGAAMTRRVRLKAAEKYVEAIGQLSADDRKKLLDGIKVIFDVIEKTKKTDP